MMLKLTLAKQAEMAKAYRKKLDAVKPRVDNAAPRLTPEIYIKSKTLVRQSVEMQAQIQMNLQLISKINIINRTAGRTNCWEYPANTKKFEKLRRMRMLQMKKLSEDNKTIYKFLDAAKTTIPPQVKAFHPKPPERVQGSAENTLETAESSARSISGFNKYWMDFETDGGVVLGRMTVELFEKKCPLACQLFKKLIKGTPEGRGYGGTKVFLVVPNMFCSLGDAVDNDGFGELIQEEKLSIPENFLLSHNTAGILSMPVHNGYVNGMFNITFKALPLLDGTAVVFGRAVSGKHLLNTFSDMGTPSGLTVGKLFIKQCGWINRRNKICYGSNNTLLPKDPRAKQSKSSF